MKPTDQFTFIVVDRDYDREAAAEALAARFLRGNKRDGLVALQRGMFANVEDASDIYKAVRPHGYAVRGKDLGRVGSCSRKSH